MSDWTIRPEQKGDEAAISALTTAAFATAAHSNGTEAVIVERLRDAGELTLSLVATNEAGLLVGHVAFSPVRIADGSENWFGLGPISVLPTCQGQGIGAALIREGLGRLEEHGAAGCVVLGEPAYYGRFGFAHDPMLTYPGPPADYFQRLVLCGDAPSGVVSYSNAFG